MDGAKNNGVREANKQENKANIWDQVEHEDKKEGKKSKHPPEERRETRIEMDENKEMKTEDHNYGEPAKEINLLSMKKREKIAIGKEFSVPHITEEEDVHEIKKNNSPDEPMKDKESSPEKKEEEVPEIKKIVLTAAEPVKDIEHNPEKKRRKYLN